MARGQVGLYKTNDGAVPAVVRAQYDADGAVVDDAAAGADWGDVDTVTCVLLGFSNGVRKDVAVAANEGAAAVNEFFFVDNTTS